MTQTRIRNQSMVLCILPNHNTKANNIKRH